MKRALLLLLASLPAFLRADDVFLKGGGKVSGRIVKRTATSVEVDVGAGTVTLPMTRVERIQVGRSALQDYYDRAGALASNDAAGWKDLARWASAQGLATQAREAYERVLRIDPGDRDANLARGNVELEGQWVSEAEGYRARGYVQFEGKWMTQAEQEAILRQRAAESEASRSQRAMDAQVREAEARAREAEARAVAAEGEARDAEYADEGIPLWWGGGWGLGPGIWPPLVPPVRPSRPPATTRPRPPQTRPNPHAQPKPVATPNPRPSSPPGAVAPRTPQN
jgi:tetratricopeptide (TPR) repeat protein